MPRLFARIGYLLLLLSSGLLLGCDAQVESPTPPPAVEPRRDLASAFDPRDCGTITGQVLWHGPVPDVPGYKGPLSPRAETAFGPKRAWPNPRAPIIGPNREVASAVVFLRGIDLQRSRPWDHPPVRVELRDYQMHILQGNLDSSYGFVRCGQEIEMVSRQDFFHSIQVRGAAFFMTPFADPDVIYQRRLTRPGVVELSSGSGCFWMGAHLFVDDHPYYTRTDAEGRFTLTQVPSGKYKLVCWLPSWKETNRELDGDTWEIASIQYGPPLEVKRQVHVVAGQELKLPISFLRRLPKELPHEVDRRRSSLPDGPDQGAESNVLPRSGP